MAENPLWDYFWHGAKQNSSMYMSYCKGCVAVELQKTGATASTLTQDTAAFKAGEIDVKACQAVGNTRGEKHAWIAHILGGKTPCPNASAEARAEATLQKTGSGSGSSQKRQRTEFTPADASEPPPKKKQAQSTLTGLTFRRNNMPFGADEKAAFQKQALRSVVSSGAPLKLFEDPEVKILLGMLRTTAPGVIPTAKVVGGRLLQGELGIKISEGGRGGGGGGTDGWKGNNRESINGLCANVDFKAYLLELINVTAENKDGPSQCDHFAEMIDRVEFKYGCIVIYFTTDADGGSKKGRTILGKKRPWLILPSCWAHQFQLILGDYFKVNDAAAIIAEDATGLIAWINNHSKVRVIFNEAQRTIQVSNGIVKIIILAYLVANITRWTTHYVAFVRLFLLREALEFAVLQNRPAIIAAQVGAATSTEAVRLKEDAERFCGLIRDQTFWEGLETVLGDLEPICLGTNINQKDSTRLDQVLLTIAGIYLRFAEHPEKEVRVSMLKRLEKRWKDCDQSVFLLALILNPFEKLSCFGPNANLNQIKCRNMLLMVYRRVRSRPDNEDTPAQRDVKEKAVSKAFMQYLAGTGDFADLNDWEEMSGNTDLIQVWEALVDSAHLAELSKFAVEILSIVANQAGCERTFSRTKIEQSDRRNRLGLAKIDKRVKIRAELRAEHARQGLVKSREGRKNHKSTAALLSVPRYRDLLEDQDDEDETERGRALVSSAEGWRLQLAEWIADAKSAETAERAEAAERPKWAPITLALLFGGAEKPRARKPSARVMEEEEMLMQALADEEEDAIPDDGAIEVNSDEEYS
ncbi:ribonuclease H-like domain-containing protein [Mycena metata]|uniref:Ribonuclease H-like domain-containing protein n=1 Tax=Mycena metata TaxID=1033252 RepID=A0AAD7HYW6_9AGAR|nr:ribonuclease H-like domain-containing protein [Mycena metata]